MIRVVEQLLFELDALTFDWCVTLVAIRTEQCTFARFAKRPQQIVNNVWTENAKQLDIAPHLEEE